MTDEALENTFEGFDIGINEATKNRIDCLVDGYEFDAVTRIEES